MVKNLPASAEDVRGTGSSPGSGRSPGEVCGNPRQYSCWENPMDRGTWQAIVREVVKNWTLLSIWAQRKRTFPEYIWTFQVVWWRKNPHANAGDAGEVGSIPRLGRSSGGGNGNPLSGTLAWRIPWTEEPGGLQPLGLQSRVWLSDWGCLRWVRSIFCVPALFLAALHGGAYFMLSETLWKRCHCPRWLTSLVK